MALVTEVARGTATVSVLRKEACAACSGKYFCGSSKKTVSKAVDPIGVKVGDTVEVEARSGIVLGYAALLFVMPIVLSAVLYSVLCNVNNVLAVVSAVVGFALPYLAALIIEKTTKVSLPVITRIESRNVGQNDPETCVSRCDGDNESV